jgi:hypothetical protein
MTLRFTQCVALALTLAVTPAFAMSSHHRTSRHHREVRHSRHHHTVAHWKPGQREIDSDRATEIQQALIERKYLTGPATGEWDDTTEAAMQKFQSDNGWQTRLMPDSRALIKLGLGPNGAAGVVPGNSTAVADSAAPNGPLQQATGANTLASIHSILN